MQKQVLLLLKLMLFFGLFSVIFKQDMNWDLKNYHFYNAYAFLHDRMGYDIAPATLQTYFNPFLDIFNYFFITTQKPIVTSFILGTISGITAFFTYQLGLILFQDRKLSLYATLIGVTGFAGIAQLGATTNETKTACLIIISIYYLAKYLFTERKLIWLFAGGILTGLAVGFKLTAAPYGLGIFAGFILSEKPSRAHLLASIWLLLFIGIGFLVSNGYWMWYLYHHFQNPFFPFYNNIFHSPYADLSNYEDPRFRPHSFINYILLPFHFFTENKLTTEAWMRDPRLPVCFIVIILWFFIALKTKISLGFSKLPIVLRFLLITFLISYLSWLTKFTIYRYAVVLEILSGYLIIYFLNNILDLLKFSREQLLKKIIFPILIISILAMTGYTGWGRVWYGQKFFEVSVPAIPPHALLMIFNGDPLAYLVPFFPEDTRAIGIGNYFMEPTYQNKLQSQANNLIQNFKNIKGPIYGLLVENKKDKDQAKNKAITQAQKTLNYYHLYIDNKQCISFPNKLDKTLLCHIKV